MQENIVYSPKFIHLLRPEEIGARRKADDRKGQTAGGSKPPPYREGRDGGRFASVRRDTCPQVSATLR